MNRLADVVTVGGNRVIASWDAVSTTPTFQTRSDNAACTYTRAETNGSAAGRSRLLESLTAGNPRYGCLDFARSAAARATFVSTPSLTWIPYAAQSFTFAVKRDGDVSRSLSLTDIQSIYKCLLTPDIHPRLPSVTLADGVAGGSQATRAFWLAQMGITEAQVAGGFYPCLVPSGQNAGGGVVASASRSDGLVSLGMPLTAVSPAVGDVLTIAQLPGFNGNCTVTAAPTVSVGLRTLTCSQSGPNLTGSPTSASVAFPQAGTPGTGRAWVPANDARSLRNDEIMPFDIGQFSLQLSGARPDLAGSIALGQIGDRVPIDASADTPLRRSLYNIIPTSRIATVPWSTVFVGPSSLICSRVDVVRSEGLSAAPTCGDASSQS